jgi:tRNA dimethylallyltransferase
MEKDSRPPLVIILGPTGVGKTEASLALAERLNGEIVSADSRLLYRGMDIGTAKPTPEEIAQVPHHLVDVADPDETWSLALFQAEARRAIAGIHARERLPFLVGGTGQYIQAVIEEWKIPKVGPDPRLRQTLQNWAGDIGPNELHKRLTCLDPEAAASIDPRNLRRTIRALEVILQTGRLFSSQKQRGTSPYRTIRLGLTRPRPDLYQRIDERVDNMIETGMIDEVRELLRKGYSPDLPSLSAIGYREIIAHLQGRTSLEGAVIEIKRATRIFVRRQANWFKTSDPGIHWFQVDPEVVDRMEQTIRSWL